MMCSLRSASAYSSSSFARSSCTRSAFSRAKYSSSFRLGFLFVGCIIPMWCQAPTRASIDSNSGSPSAEPTSLARDLEAVADGEHRPAALGERDHLLHDRAEASDRAGAQVVAVREAAGENHDVGALEVVVLVPQVRCLLAQRVGHGVVGV